MVAALSSNGACFKETLPGELAARLDAADLEALAGEVAGALADDGVTFGPEAGAFQVDPVPRVLPAAEWAPLADGLCQRVRALDRFVADVYGRQCIVREGVVPATAVSSAAYFEPLLQQHVHDERRWITIAGLDVVRGRDGAFRVLEDNVRTPSGVAYALAARRAVSRHLPPADDLRPLALEPSLAFLAGALRHAAPPEIEEPVVAVLTDGAGNSAFYDHRELAERLGFALVRLGDLRLRDGYLHAKIDGRAIRVDVVYRRTDEDRLNHPRGGLTSVAQLLLEPWARGRLGLVNAFGTGVADDKLLHAYVEDMIRFYLEEEPLLASVKTWDLSEPGALNRALASLDEVVIKPRAGHGGAGVMIGPLATPAERDAGAAALRGNPSEHVVQDFSPLSVHPTVVDGRLAPRHVDLRPFVFYGAEDVHAMPGGLTRVALAENEMVVNSSRAGGAKDTWVLP